MIVKLAYRNLRDPKPILDNGKHVVGLDEVVGRKYRGKRIDTTVEREVETTAVTRLAGDVFGLLDEVVTFQ